MIDPAVLWTIGIAIVVLPFAVTYSLNGRNQSDARGQRVSTRWQGRSLLPAGSGATALDHHDSHPHDGHGDGHTEVGPEDHGITHAPDTAPDADADAGGPAGTRAADDTPRQ